MSIQVLDKISGEVGILNKTQKNIVNDLKIRANQLINPDNSTHAKVKTTFIKNYFRIVMASTGACFTAS